jgi:hypothetical protein
MINIHIAETLQSKTHGDLYLLDLEKVFIKVGREKRSHRIIKKMGGRRQDSWNSATFSAK